MVHSAASLAAELLCAAVAMRGAKVQTLHFLDSATIMSTFNRAYLQCQFRVASSVRDGLSALRLGFCL